jgi:hypothetical protein
VSSSVRGSDKFSARLKLIIAFSIVYTVRNSRSDGALVDKMPEKKKMKRTNSYFKVNVTINSANFVIARSSLSSDEIIEFRQGSKIYNYTCV